MNLSTTDLHLLRAAEGWIELGDWQSANEELENITPTLRAHPDVLKMRVAVYMAAKHWELTLAVAEKLVELLPGDLNGWIHRSFALHEFKRTAEAGRVIYDATWRAGYVKPFVHAKEQATFFGLPAWVVEALTTGFMELVDDSKPAAP
ncbi:MAG: hypothetical protein EXS36_04535 [Pedosphaera sp.]|nr:hypothetical protein [Pedosphaera sp.]